MDELQRMAERGCWVQLLVYEHQDAVRWSITVKLADHSVQYVSTNPHEVVAWASRWLDSKLPKKKHKLVRRKKS